MGACSQFGMVVHCRKSGMNSVPHWAFTCLHLPQAAAGVGPRGSKAAPADYMSKGCGPSTHPKGIMREICIIRQKNKKIVANPFSLW